MTKSIFTLILWIVFAALSVVLIAQPIGLQAQFVLGLAAIISLLVIRLISKTGGWRFAFLGIAGFVVLRYFYWRTTSTLPPITSPINFIPGIILYIAEAYSVLLLFISMFVVLDPLRRARAPRLSDEQLPTVDVLVPTFNEDIDLVATTLAAAKAMVYPAHKLNVYLCDDGGTDQKLRGGDTNDGISARRRRDRLVQICEQLGVGYLTRENNYQAKAGNLSAALKKTSGELVVVFDSDHAPARDFLTETVGYFSEDPKLFLVQTPHFFLNPDPVEKNLDSWDYMPSENEMFYSETQLGLDKWNAAFFCGSAAVLRRKALEENGGFSGMSITEDCETSLDIQARGWNSIYVDKPLIAGLQPTDFTDFIGQRSRWARGMAQIFLLKNPLFKRGLTLAQRICYLSSELYWFFPLSRMVFILVPLFTIFFDLQIFRANLQEFIAYTGSYVIVNLLVQNYLYGRLRWTWISEVYEYVQGLYLYQAVFGVIFNVRNPTFKVTAKGVTYERDHLSELAGPFVIIFIVLLISQIVAIMRILTGNSSNDVMWIVGGWNLLNLLIAGVGLGVVSERHELRRTHRISISRPSTLIIGGISYRVTVEDASQGGMLLRPVDGGLLSVRAEDGVIGLLSIQLANSTVMAEPVSVVMRRQGSDSLGTWYGLEFLHMQAREYVLVTDLMYADSAVFSKFRDSRRSDPGIIRNTLRLIFWGFREPLRALSYILLNRRYRSDLKRKPPQGPNPPALTSPGKAETGTFAEASSVNRNPTTTSLPVIAAFGLGLIGLIAGGMADHASAQPLPIPANQGEITTGPGNPLVTPAPLADTSNPTSLANTPTIVPTQWLRRLPAGRDGLRFEGEIATHTWSVFISRAQAAAPAQFKLGFTNAVSVMPEASNVKIFVNDVLVGTEPLNGVIGLHRVVTSIPAGVLQPGFNQVRFIVSQRHRVDCSVNSTYELWTQFEPAETGLLFPINTQTIDRLSDLASISPGPDGRLHLRLVVARPNDTALVAEAFEVGEQVSLATGIADPIVEVDNAPGSGPGIDVLVGTAADFRAMGLDAAVAGEAVRGATLIRQQNIFTDRATIAVGALNADDLATAVRHLAGLVWSDAIPGSPAGIAALQGENGKLLHPGETYTFKDLGLTTQNFSGRYNKVGFNVQLPSDFLAADYRTIEAHLKLAYAAGLLPGAQFVFAVNGTVTTTVDLSRPGGEMARDRDVTIPLDKFRPGINRIELSAIVPAAVDPTCSPVEQINGVTRMSIFDNSTLSIPSFAMIGQLPSLSSTFSSGYPYVDQGKFKLFLPRADANSLNAAGTFIIRLANSVGKVMPVEILQGVPMAGAGTAIVVGAVNDMPIEVVEAVGIDGRSIGNTLASQLRTTVGDTASENHSLTPGQLRTIDAQDDTAAANHAIDTGDYGISTVFQPLIDGLRRSFDLPIAHGVGTASGGLIAPPAGTTVIVGQNTVSAKDNSEWTVVTAANSDELVKGVNAMVENGNWHKFAGAVTSFNADTDTASVVPADHARLVATGSFGLDNLRLTIAGWFSLNPGTYVLAMLITGVIVSLLTYRLVRRSGRQSIE